MKDFKFVSLETLHKEFKKREKDHRKSTRDQFLAFDPKRRVYIAVDNRTFDFFMEEFKTHDEAVTWLQQDQFFISYYIIRMSKKDLIQALCDYFEIEVEGDYVTNENMEEILKGYDFVS